MRKLNVLVGCESSGEVRNAFRALGHNAYSCDLLPADDNSPYHIQGDVLEAIDSENWDIGIFHPPCQYLASSGMHWTRRGLRDPQLTEDALDFVRALLNADIPHIALENPVGCISTRIRKPDQYIQPYMFGHNASKKTGLWLKKLPPLAATNYCSPERYFEGKPRWANQCDKAGQDKLGPSDDRWKIRSKTYGGIANAMANQWSEHILKNYG